jgi:hypothetical protein
MNNQSIFAKCKRPQHAGCQKPQELKAAVFMEPGAKLKNRCRWCRGELKRMTSEEIRGYWDSQNF